MRVDLYDVICAFSRDTYFSIMDRDDRAHIFDGTQSEVMRWLETTDNEFTVRFGDVYPTYFSVDPGDSVVNVFVDVRILY